MAQTASAITWSVMIPSYEPRPDYLAETLRSVLSQDPGPEKMQIEVVDDCSPKIDVEGLVREIAGDRVKVHKLPKNLGLAGCWNTCIDRARGEWVHILHQDDYVLPGFYGNLFRLIEKYPTAGLIASRSFFVDQDGIITAVTARVRSLESGGQSPDDFFYQTPIQCSGVMVKRSFYEQHGKFRADLLYGIDCEMWARVVAESGGVVSSEVLSCYRVYGENETGRLARTAENLRDLERLNGVFAARYPNFDQGRGTERLLFMALKQAESFKQKGDLAAARENERYWQQHAPVSLRFRRYFGRWGRKIIKYQSPTDTRKHL